MPKKPLNAFAWLFFFAPIQIGKVLIHLTISIGLAQAAVDDANLQAIIEHADQALYLAKSVGRNRISL